VDNEAIGQVICRKAKELEASAVVVAKHTKGPLTDFFMGSVCKYCCTHCPQTLIVARCEQQ
jgi:nucleotide-binding universal stress UspA family protein